MRKLRSISCTYTNKSRDAGKLMNIVSEYNLWWTEKTSEQSGQWNSVVILTEEFFKEIMASPIIFYADILKILRKSPMALDIYMWLTYKNSYSKTPMMISWESLQLQFGAGYPFTTKGKLNFKRKFEEAVKKIKVVYPEAKRLEILSEGLKFTPGSTHVPKTNAYRHRHPENLPDG